MALICTSVGVRYSKPSSALRSGSAKPSEAKVMRQFESRKAVVYPTLRVGSVTAHPALTSGASEDRAPATFKVKPQAFSNAAQTGQESNNAQVGRVLMNELAEPLAKADDCTMGSRKPRDLHEF